MYEFFCTVFVPEGSKPSSGPQEPQPVETHTEEAVQEIQTPSTEPTAHEEVAPPEPTMDVGSIPAEVASAAGELTEFLNHKNPLRFSSSWRSCWRTDNQTPSTEPVRLELLVEEAVEYIQSPSTEPTGQDIPPIYTVEDPDVKDIGGPSSPGLHMQVYAPKVLQQPSEVVEIGDSPASGRGVEIRWTTGRAMTN
ncbi:hypothetical protein R1sor_008064 [Riccia sorocarpa]|uniref:Uncharacterized protein n=1 Tax=Riccia sorocarpa TaxID=122646 RepID=A0ABD3HSB5_9MARC